MTQPDTGADHAACPPWCRRDHGASAHPEDRRHRGEPATLTATLAVLDGAGLQPRELTADLVVQRFQDDPAAPVWIQITAAEVPAAPDAAPIGLIIHASDVTELRRALAAA